MPHFEKSLAIGVGSICVWGAYNEMSIDGGDLYTRSGYYKVTGRTPVIVVFQVISSLGDDTGGEKEEIIGARRVKLRCDENRIQVTVMVVHTSKEFAASIFLRLRDLFSSSRLVEYLPGGFQSFSSCFNLLFVFALVYRYRQR